MLLKEIVAEPSLGMCPDFIVDEHEEHEVHPRGRRSEHVDNGARGHGRHLRAPPHHPCDLVIELERDILRVRDDPAVGGRDGADDLQGIVGASPQEVPPRWLGAERQDSEVERGERGDDVEQAPGSREERCDATREEIEGGHAAWAL